MKNIAKIRFDDLRSLKAFKADYPESAPYLLYRGKERMKSDGVLCVPCEDFLLGLGAGNTRLA